MLGKLWCDDDWCLSSLANHGPRSAKGAWVRLTDDRKRRFLPVFDASVVSFDADLLPHAAPVKTTLTFDVPSDSRELYFEAGLRGLHYDSFIIGSRDLAGKPRFRFRLL
jgi:hypothetical protein